MKALVLCFLVLAAVPFRGVNAQAPAGLESGDRVRVVAPGCYTQLEDLSFVSSVGDSLFFRRNGEDLSCPLTLVRSMEVYRGRDHWTRGAWIGAGIGGGLATLGAVLAADGKDDYFYGIIPVVAGLGGALGNGPRTRQWALIGTGAGAVVTLGLAGSAGELGLAIGLMAAMPAGMALGSILGFALGEDRWEEVQAFRLKPNLILSPDGGLGLGISVPVGWWR